MHPSRPPPTVRGARRRPLGRGGRRPLSWPAAAAGRRLAAAVSVSTGPWTVDTAWWVVRAGGGGGEGMGRRAARVRTARCAAVRVGRAMAGAATQGRGGLVSIGGGCHHGTLWLLAAGRARRSRFSLPSPRPPLRRRAAAVKAPTVCGGVTTAAAWERAGATRSKASASAHAVSRRLARSSGAGRGAGTQSGAASLGQAARLSPSPTVPLPARRASVHRPRSHWCFRRRNGRNRSGLSPGASSAGAAEADATLVEPRGGRRRAAGGGGPPSAAATGPAVASTGGMACGVGGAAVAVGGGLGCR